MFFLIKSFIERFLEWEKYYIRRNPPLFLNIISKSKNIREK